MRQHRNAPQLIWALGDSGQSKAGVGTKLAKSWGAFPPQCRVSLGRLVALGEHLAPCLLGFSGIFAALAGIPPLMTAERAVSSHGPVAPAQCQQLSSSCCQSADASREGCSGHGRVSGQFRQKAVPDRSSQELGCGCAVRMAFGPRCPLWVVQMGSLVVRLCNPVWSLYAVPGTRVMVWGQRALETRVSLSRSPRVLPAGLAVGGTWEGHQPCRASMI